MTADFNKPNASSDIVTVMAEIRENESAVASQFKSVVADNIPLNAVKFDAGIHYRWNSLNWITENIAIAGGGTGSSTASGARTNLSVYSKAETDTEISSAVSNLSSGLGTSSVLDSVTSPTDTTSNRVLTTGYNVQSLSNVGSAASATLVSGSTDTTSGRVLTTGYDIASLANAGNVVTLDVVTDESDTTSGRVLTTGYGVQYLANAGTSVTYDVTTGETDTANGANGLPKVVRSSDTVMGAYKKTVTVNFSSDANLTLTGAQNQYGKVVLTDTGGILTASRTVFLSTDERMLKVKNETEFDIKISTVSGTGIHVSSGEMFYLNCDGSNVESSGTDNKVLIKDISILTSGSVSYPFSLDQSDFDKIEFNFAVTTEPQGARTSTNVTKNRISEYPASWYARPFYGSDSVTVTIDVSYSTDNSFSVSSSTGDAGLADVYGYLKDGVTY